jgi:hypothetical protein
MQCYNCKNFGHVGAKVYIDLLQLHPRWRETSSGIISRMQPCTSRTAKEKSTINSHGILWEDALL